MIQHLFLTAFQWGQMVLCCNNFMFSVISSLAVKVRCVRVSSLGIFLNHAL